MSGTPPRIKVLCVDDNSFVAEAIELKVLAQPDMQWLGWLSDAGGLVALARESSPDIILLDIDMPGRDPFDALRELYASCPRVRVIMLSGHVRRDLFDRAVDAGSWGYVSKDEDSETILSAIRTVAGGGFAIGPTMEAENNRAGGS
jgi:two-component system response regulator DesR